MDNGKRIIGILLCKEQWNCYCAIDNGTIIVPLSLLFHKQWEETMDNWRTMGNIGNNERIGTIETQPQEKV
jgi:hypothetical protein